METSVATATDRRTTLGEELIAWRRREGIRAAEAARRCKMSPQYYGMVENGERTDLKASFVLAIAEATGLPVDLIARSSVAA